MSSIDRSRGKPLLRAVETSNPAMEVPTHACDCAKLGEAALKNS
jgi:hypothetical protein